MPLILCDEYISRWVLVDWIMMRILYSELPLRTINCMFVALSMYVLAFLGASLVLENMGLSLLQLSQKFYGCVRTR